MIGQVLNERMWYDDTFFIECDKAHIMIRRSMAEITEYRKTWVMVSWSMEL